MTYAMAVAWIARHEPHTTHNPLMMTGEPLAAEIVATYVTVAMVSDCFGRDVGCVVQDVCAEHRAQSYKPQRTVADVRRAFGR